MPACQTSRFVIVEANIVSTTRNWSLVQTNLSLQFHPLLICRRGLLSLAPRLVYARNVGRITWRKQNRSSSFSRSMLTDSVLIFRASDSTPDHETQNLITRSRGVSLGNPVTAFRLSSQYQIGVCSCTCVRFCQA
jgi:hypothetical protein